MTQPIENDLEVKFFPCNCGHLREEHVHGKVFSIDGDKTWLGYCKRQWNKECPCDIFTMMDALQYLEWKYDTTRQTIY